MKPREHQREVSAWLAGIGASNIRIEQRSKHPHILFRWHGRDWRSALSGSPGDFHVTRAAINSLRHMLGLTGGKRIGERRVRKPRRAATPATAAW